MSRHLAVSFAILLTLLALPIDAQDREGVPLGLHSSDSPPLAPAEPLPATGLPEVPAVQGVPYIAPFAGFPLYSSAELMPIPDDPTDLQTHAPTRTADLGEGIRLYDGIVFRAGVKAELNMTYDTGVIESSLKPSGIALEGSDEAHGSGIFDMTTFSGSLKSDFQIPDLPLWPQAFVDLRVTDDDIEDRHVYARVENVLGGQYYSTFSDIGALPESIVPNAAPAGFISVFEQVQLMYLYQLTPNFSITPAIARPNSDDFTLVNNDDDTRLRRWPDFITRVRYRPSNYESAQAAVLVRQMGYEDSGGAEHFVTGWGVAGTLRFRTWDLNNICLGVVGGQGLGDYLFGLSGDQISAAPTNGELAALSNFGAYAGYQAIWTDTLVSTVAYGFAGVEARPDLAAKIRNTQNGWVNLVWTPAEKVAVGVEYQYGFREIQNGRIGDNHHLQLTLSVTMAAKSEAERARSTAAVREYRNLAGVREEEARPAMTWERM